MPLYLQAIYPLHNLDIVCNKKTWVTTAFGVCRLPAQLAALSTAGSSCKHYAKVGSCGAVRVVEYPKKYPPLDFFN